MKKQAYTTITTLGLFLMLGIASVHAQALSDGKMTVDIPFDFSVGNTRLSAGKYTVQQITPTPDEGLSIRSIDGRASATTGITRPDRASTIQAKSKLVFNRYGDQYFLSQVWTAGNDHGRELFVSRSERVLAKEAELASGASKPKTVAVAARQP